MLRRDLDEQQRVKAERELDERINVLKRTALTQAFPVGAIYISTSSANPATALGYGTWSAFGTGRVLVGIDTSDPDFDTVEETGGSK